MSDPVGLLRAMLAIPSVSGQEQQLAEFLREDMRARGMSARIDDVGNVIGETGAADGPTIVLLGHMDTVPGLIPLRQSGDRLYGRGSGDAKGPLAAFICAADALRDVPARIRVIGCVEEEVPSSRGAAGIGLGPAPDALIVGEPSGVDKVVIGYKGRVDMRYRVTRPAVHTSHWAEKAPEAATAFWQRAKDAVARTRTTSEFTSTSIALCGFTGTLTDAELGIILRTPISVTAAEVHRILAAVADDGQLTLTGAVEAVRVGRDDPVVRALSASIRGRGMRPRHTVKSGTSDMNTLAGAWGPIPMATYGPGDGLLDHSADEHILIPDFLTSIDILVDAVRRLAGQLTREFAAHKVEAEA